MAEGQALLDRVEQLARCAGCNAARDRRLPACPECGRLGLPPHEEWGKPFKRWLVLRVLAAKTAAYPQATLQFLWERILQDAMMLEPAVKRATPLPDLYAAAQRLYPQWLERGATPPAPFESIGDV